MHQDKKRYRGEYIIIQKLPPSPQGGTFFDLENENLDHASGAFFVAFHSFLFWKRIVNPNKWASVQNTKGVLSKGGKRLKVGGAKRRNICLKSMEFNNA